MAIGPGALARLRVLAVPAIALAGCIIFVLVLAQLPPWHAFGAWLIALDFDQERAWMLQSLTAGMVLALLGAFATARPWISSLLAAAFVWLSYVLGLGDRLSHNIPSLLGVKEQLVSSALLKNQLVILALALLSAMPLAWLGWLAHRVVGGETGAARPVRAMPPRPIQVAAGSLVVIMAAASTALAISGADPLLRVGPIYHVYRLPAAPARTIAAPASPGAVETVPTNGQVQDRSYFSTAMNEERHYLIYLPPSYGLRASATRRYPVLYLLHGDPSNPGEWVRLGAPALFDNGLLRESIPETILVMPDGNGHVTTATEWADRADGRDRIESALVELVGVVDEQNRTIADRAHRSIAGLSSGAFGAANIAARHPGLFGTAMSFSGTFIANGPVFGSKWRANSPYYLVQDQPASRTVRYLITVGSKDGWRKQQAEQFAAQLRRLGVPYALHYLPGGHGGEVWAASLALSVQQISS